MNFKELNLKPVYYFDECNLLFDFYIPLLSKSIKYDRIAGYFCSNSLAIAAKGISDLIKNGGRIRLIANVVISLQDQDAIKKALAKKEEEILIEIDNLEDQLQKNHIRMLGWLIKQNLLEIKIVVVNNSNGIEHEKIGIVYDCECNKVSFSGSENETFNGWLNNNEQFHVFCSWIEGDLNHLNPDIDHFEKLWNNLGNKVKTYKISEAFSKGLIERAPKSDKDFQIVDQQITRELENRYKNNVIKKEEPKLRDYQLKAIKNWEENNYGGIFEMATGTGKTFTALGCLKNLINKNNKLLTVISCPYQHLIIQWEKSIKKFTFNYKIVIADSTNSKWKKQLTNFLYDLNNGVISNLIVITTHETFGNSDFVKIILESKFNKFLIVDEVHGIGSDHRCEGLIENYNYRLGLSATPDRWFDEEGTKIIRSFFGKTVYEFSLKDAINTIDPETGKTYLVKYDYKPIFVELNNDEIDEYEKQTSKIVKSLNFSKNTKEKEELLKLLLIKRQKIIINAINKLNAFNEIISSFNQIKHCLVYCSPEQISEVQKIINEHEIIQHKFTHRENTKSEKDFEYLSEREFLLKEFEIGKYQILVAMKCLDEGVDVPQARIAIILASSSNPREYIQRRGRILRPYPKKDKAIIYDFIVTPPLNKIFNKNLKDIEKKIIEKEFIRYKEFADASNNKLECLNKIYKVQEYLGI